MIESTRRRIVAVISGPDGCGKSFIIGALQEKNLAFKHFHIWPREHRALPLVRPEVLSAKPYGFCLSISKFIFVVGKFWLLYLFQYYTARENVFIFDRYLDELNLNSQRYRISNSVAKFLSIRMLLPKPHYRFLIVSPIEHVLKKGELTKDEVERFYHDYRRSFPDSIEITNEFGTDSAPNDIYNILSR